MKKALITGASGFVGGYLATELENFGYQVFKNDHNKVSVSENNFLVDITDKNKVLEIIKKVEPNFIFHLAGVSSPLFAEKNRDLTLAVNVHGTENILEAALTLKNPPKVLVVGSSYVYGSPEYLPLDELHPLNGRGVYAESRILQEETVKKFSTRLPIILTRSFNHTGPGQDETFVVPKIIKGIIELKLNRKQELLTGSLDLKRDISDVRDVVRWYRLLLEQEKFGVITNICRGETISLREIVEKAKKLADLQIADIKIGESLLRKDDPLEIVGSNNVLSDLIKNVSSGFTYEKMVQDIYEFWYNKLTKNIL